MRGDGWEGEAGGGVLGKLWGVVSFLIWLKHILVNSRTQPVSL